MSKQELNLMKQLQIDYLRDFAIDHLPRAKADSDQFSRYGGTESDFYRKLAFTSVMVQGKPTAPAIEIAAARVLSSISLLRSEREEPLPRDERADILSRLTSDAQELCALTGKQIPWLDSIKTPPEPEEQTEREVPQAQAPAPSPQSIAGKLLTVNQAAEKLGLKPATLRKWAREQRGSLLPSVQIGRQYRYSGDEVLALMQSEHLPTPRSRQ